MNLFQVPPPTRYDLHFSIAGIPVRVHPLFWLVTLLLGSSGRISLVRILIWVVVVFISILVHELGHALAMRMYGQDASVVLYGGGGLAIPRFARRGRDGFDRNQQIVVSLAGPLAGFLLAALVLLIVVVLGGNVSMLPLFGIIPLLQASIPAGGTGGFVANLLISIFLWVNIFWGLINLMPIYPLDGGRVSQTVWTSVDPWDGARKSLWLSVVAAGLVALVGLLLLSMYMLIFFGFLAFQSYQLATGRALY